MWLVVASCLCVVGCRIGFDAVVGCDNGIRDGNELGIDCGGTCSGKCPGAPCNISRDCATATCSGGQCALASGPPSWRPGPPLPADRALISCTTWRDEVWCAGGIDPLGSSMSEVWALSRDGVWRQATSLPTAVANQPLVVVGDALYSFCGRVALGSQTTLLQIYDGTSWRTGASCTGGREAHRAQLFTGQVYVTDLDETSRYDPIADAWLAPLSTSLQGTDSHGSAIANNGELVVIGGHDRPSGGATAIVSALAPGTDTWRALPSLPRPLEVLGAVTAPDGRIYAVGGAPATSAVYALSDDRWHEVAPLAETRHSHAATVGPDGRIYAIAGVGAADSTSSVEIYGPLITLSSDSSTPGDEIMVTATNFAAGATLAITLDDALIATATTDDAGAASIAVTIPELGTGTYQLVATDARSRYPVTARLDVR